MRINGLLPIDAGIFQCIGVNPAGTVQASARLTINQPSEFYHEVSYTPRFINRSTNISSREIFLVFFLYIDFTYICFILFIFLFLHLFLKLFEILILSLFIFSLLAYSLPINCSAC